MDKFSKINLKEQQDKNNIDSKHNIDIIKYKEEYFVKEQDRVIILPYFVDDGFILMRNENIIPYQYGYMYDNLNKNLQSFLTVITEKIEVGENPKNTVRRGLYEEAGIVLNSLFDVEISQPLYISKKNCSKYYYSLLEIRYNDYKQTSPKIMDKTDLKSQIIKIDLGYIDDIKTHDIVTELMLEKLKYLIKPKK